jgi:AAHS family 3-hydroxyphenylpropionic acid transporter
MTSMSLVSAQIESHRLHLGEDFLLERACACRPRCANSLARRLNWLPFLLLTRGLLKEQAAMAQAGFNVGGAVTGFWIGVLLDRRWRRVSIAASLVMLPVILFLLAVSPARPELLLGLTFLPGGAISAEQVIVYAVATSCYSVAARGTGVGAAVAAGRLGSLAGPLFAASFLAAGRGPSQVLLGVIPIVVACGICVGLLGWRELPPRIDPER